MITYTAQARRWKHGWELHIAGVGVTQATKLTDAEHMVRDYIALDLGVAPDSFNVEIVPDVDDAEIETEMRQARKAAEEAAAAQQRAATAGRRATRSLKRLGLTGREIAVILRISPQRVSQLLKPSGGRSEAHAPEDLPCRH